MFNFEMTFNTFHYKLINYDSLQRFHEILRNECICSLRCTNWQSCMGKLYRTCTYCGGGFECPEAFGHRVIKSKTITRQASACNLPEREKGVNSTTGMNSQGLQQSPWIAAEITIWKLDPHETWSSFHWLSIAGGWMEATFKPTSPLLRCVFFKETCSPFHAAFPSFILFPSPIHSPGCQRGICSCGIRRTEVC